MKRLAVFLFLIAIGLGISSKSWAQNPVKELHQKTEDRLGNIIERSPAITGLAVVDLTTNKTVFAFNGDQIFPQASAIKIPILMNVFKQTEQGKFQLSDKRTVDPENMVGGTGILKHLGAGNAYSIRDLCVFMIALSDNSATNELITLAGMENINTMLADMEMPGTRLRRKMMDIEASAKEHENTSTPAEAAQILQMLYNGSFINKEVSASIISFLEKTPRRESRLGAGIPGDIPVAFKPGELKGVSTEWAIIQLEERPYAVAVMEKLKLDNKAEKSVEKLSEILYNYFWRLGNSTRYGVYRDPEMIK